MTDAWEDRQARIRARVERHFIDPDNGLVFTFLDRETLRPPEDALFAGAERDPKFSVDGVTMAEMHRHENCGMCTGAYMQAETLRYENDGASDALEHARRCLAAFRFVHEAGRRKEPGFFPKMYGGRYSEETSTDQVLYACCGMERFLRHATPAERAGISEMIGDLVGFWMRRDYRYPYFRACGPDWQWPLVRFPALLLLAHRVTGSASFRREYERLLPRTGMPEHCSLHRRDWQPREFERRNGAWLTSAGADRVTMDTMQFDLLLRLDPGNPMAETWRAGIRIMWDEVRENLTPDGRYHSMMLYDFDTLAPRRTPGYAVDGGNEHGARSSWSSMAARAGLQGLAHCPGLPGAEAYALRVLTHLDFEDCSYYDEPERFPPERRYQTRLLSGDAAANLLWCAQLARARRAEAETPAP